MIVTQIIVGVMLAGEDTWGVERVRRMVLAGVAFQRTRVSKGKISTALIARAHVKVHGKEFCKLFKSVTLHAMLGNR